MIDWNGCRITKMERSSFFSDTKEADVHLQVAHYVDGSKIGRVTTDDGETLAFGTEMEAKHCFYGLHASEEANFAITRAQIRAICGGKLPHED